MTTTAERVLRAVPWAICAVFAILAIATAVASLFWDYQLDTPLLQYCGLLMVKFGKVPYRDFFETSMPGTFAFHAAFVALFGTGQAAFTAVNLCFLALVLLTGWTFASRVDPVAAWLFVAWYGFAYLSGGPNMLLQRDFLTLLPIGTALALLATDRPRHAGLRRGLYGILFGLVILVKPQLAAGLPVVLAADIALEGETRARELFTSTAKATVPVVAGLAIPLAATLIVLQAYGALGPFVEMTTRYLPLHIQQANKHEYLAAAPRAFYLLKGALKLGGLVYLTPFAAVGVIAALGPLKTRRKARILVLTVAGLTVVYGLTPVLSGQFWPYHYAPFLLFAVMTLSLPAVVLHSDPEPRRLTWAAAAGLVLATGLFVAFNLKPGEYRPLPANDGKVAALVQLLKAELRPGDTVQPLDWTSGPIHAMLRLQLPLPTPFLYDYHFHHSVSRPEIQALRARFLTAMRTARPTLIVEAVQRKRVSGLDTAADFPAFDALVRQDYRPVHQDADFVIYRRADTLGAEKTPPNPPAAAPAQP